MINSKFWRSQVSLWDSSLKRIANVCNLSQIVDESKKWWFKVEVFDLKVNIEFLLYSDQLLLAVCKWLFVCLDQLLGAARYTLYIDFWLKQQKVIIFSLKVNM